MNQNRQSNPFRYLFLFFLSVIISNRRLLNFSVDHKNRMIAHNGLGIYTAKIASLTTSIASFSGSLSGLDTNLGLQHSDTQYKVNALNNFSDFAHAEEPHIAYLCRADPTIYDQFYPDGLNGINHITKENGALVMGVFRDAAHNNSVIVGVAFEVVCQGYLDAFTSAIDVQEVKMGQVGTGRVTIKNNRTSLIECLIDDIGFISSNNKTDVDAAEAFMDFSMLYRVRHVNHIHFPADNSFITTTAYTQGNAGLILLDEGTEITCANNSDAEMWIYGSATIDGAPGAVYMLVPSHSSRTMLASEIGAVIGHYINGFVNNLTIDGIWKIDIHDAL